MAVVIAYCIRYLMGVYYFKGRLDEVEAISQACHPYDIPIDPGIYRAHVLHQTSATLGLPTARRYVEGRL